MVFPLIVAAALTAGATIYGANRAADAQRAAARQAARSTAQARQDLEPYRAAGSDALSKYRDALGLNGPAAQQAYFASFQDDPYLSGILSAGVGAIENSAAARGTLYGGNTLAAISDYSGQLRKGAYDTRLAQLSGLIDGGRSAAAGAANAAQTGGQMRANYLANAGDLVGAGIINAANSGANALNNYYRDTIFKDWMRTGMSNGQVTPPQGNNTWRWF